MVLILFLCEISVILHAVYDTQAMKTRNLFISLLLIVAFVVLTPLQVVRAADTITMAFTDSPEKDATLKFLELIYSDAFQRLGREFAYKMYPMKRYVLRGSLAKSS